MFEADNFATREHRIQDPHSLIYIHYSHYISSMCGRVCLFLTWLRVWDTWNVRNHRCWSFCRWFRFGVSLAYDPFKKWGRNWPMLGWFFFWVCFFCDVLSWRIFNDFSQRFHNGAPKSSPTSAPSSSTGPERTPQRETRAAPPGRGRLWDSRWQVWNNVSMDNDWTISLKDWKISLKDWKLWKGLDTQRSFMETDEAQILETYIYIYTIYIYKRCSRNSHRSKHIHLSNPF